MRVGRSVSEPAGVWSLTDGGLARLDLEAAGPAVVLVPSEQVLTLAVDMPLKGRRERMAALPFAVEEQVAEPLDEVHVALGADIGAGRVLAGVVRHERMLAWTALVETAGLGRAAVTPDHMALPPPVDAGWSVRTVAGRSLVRQSDGVGFALPTAMLPDAWAAAGRPPLQSSGDALPAGMVADDAPIGLATRRLPPPLLDLRQGLYAVRGRPERALLRRLAAVAALAVAAHTAILAADAVALSRMAEARREEVRALVRQTAPGLPVDGDLAAELASRLAVGDGERSRFLPLLARSSGALRTVTPALRLQGLSYGADGRLTLEVETADIAGLQRAQAALTAAGLQASAGSATAVAGGAEGQLLVREAAR